MKNDVMVSVIIISYNQEKYIREAIDSVLMQKVNFKYELILADDCSPDNTKEILEEYKARCPDIVKIAYRERNLGATKNELDAEFKASGKYLTILEGDDYWCDENKLQKQVNFLELHDDYVAVSHLQEGRDLENNILGYFPKEIKKDTIICGVNDCIKNNKKFSSTATLYRNIYKNRQRYADVVELKSYDKLIGDAQTCMYLCSLGNMHD